MAALHTCRRRNSTVVLQTSRTNLPALYISGDLLAPNHLHPLIGKARTSPSRAARHWRPPPPGRGGGALQELGVAGAAWGRSPPHGPAALRSDIRKYQLVINNDTFRPDSGCSMPPWPPYGQVRNKLPSPADSNMTRYLGCMLHSSFGIQNCKMDQK